MLQDIAPHIFDNAYRPGPPGSEDLALCFGEQGVLLKDGVLPKVSDLPKTEYERLFCIDETGFFLAQSAPEELGAEPPVLRALRRQNSAQPGRAGAGLPKLRFNRIPQNLPGRHRGHLGWG